MSWCQKAIETLTTLRGWPEASKLVKEQTKTASQSNCTRSCELRRQGYRHHSSTGRWTKRPAGSARNCNILCYQLSCASAQVTRSTACVLWRKTGRTYYSCFTEEKTEAQRSCLGSYSIQANIRIRTKTPHCIIWSTYCVSEKHPVRYYSVVRVTRIATKFKYF